MAHFSAFRVSKNGLNKPCARHDSNVRPLLLRPLPVSEHGQSEASMRVGGCAGSFTTSCAGYTD
jgi:hypothetical protein